MSIKPVALWLEDVLCTRYFDLRVLAGALDRDELEFQFLHRLVFKPAHINRAAGDARRAEEVRGNV